MTLIKKGAEANLLLEDFSKKMYPNKEEKILVKHRISKEYRVKGLDESLRRYRTSLEAKLLSDAKKAGVPTPIIYKVDMSGMSILMQYIEGNSVKEILEDLDPSQRDELCCQIGKQIARLHAYGIVHGDLTTSNMIRGENGIIYFIDFGLGEYNDSVEAKGTDIHLLYRTLNSSHFRIAEETFKSVLKGYREELGDSAEEIIQRVKEIEKRGRYVAKEERR